MRWRFLSIMVVAVVVVAACDPGAREAEPFAGNWRSEGWGTLVSIEGGSVEIFESSLVHCISVAGGGARGIAEVLSLESGRLVLRDAGRLVRFDRIEFLPESCLTDPSGVDAAGVLAAAAATVEENLADPLDPRWEGRRKDLLADVTAGEALWEALVALFTPLEGVPIRISDGAGAVWAGHPVVPVPLVPGTTSAGNGTVSVGEVGDGIGYLAFGRLGSLADGEEDSQRTAARLVDGALAVPALVLDLRSADGGSLGHALLIASRFVSESGPVASLEARAGTGFVDAGNVVVTPLPAGIFEGELAVLIGPGTTGVAEILAWVLGSASTATLVGSATAGSPGPELVRLLPNGWWLGLPNLRVVAADGTDLSDGVQPDIEAADALATATDLLTSNR